MTVDPDAEGGPDPDWYRSELDACRNRIMELEANRIALGKQLVEARQLIANLRAHIDSGQ